MASLRTVVRQWPATSSAATFGLAAAVVTAAWFLPAVLASRDAVSLVLYILLPAAAAAVSGAVVAGPICNPARTMSPEAAVLRGAATATLAIIVFAPSFALLFAWTAPGRVSVVGLTVTVLVFSALALWWVVAIVGGALGWALHRITSGPHS